LQTPKNKYEESVKSAEYYTKKRAKIKWFLPKIGMQLPAK
jgi:hypothetical protein